MFLKNFFPSKKKSVDETVSRKNNIRGFLKDPDINKTTLLGLRLKDFFFFF